MIKMKSKLELRKVKKLVRNGYVPITTGEELLYVVKGNKEYKPKVNMEVR